MQYQYCTQVRLNWSLSPDNSIRITLHSLPTVAPPDAPALPDRRAGTRRQFPGSASPAGYARVTAASRTRPGAGPVSPPRLFLGQTRFQLASPLRSAAPVAPAATPGMCVMPRAWPFFHFRVPLRAGPLIREPWLARQGAPGPMAHAYPGSSPVWTAIHDTPGLRRFRVNAVCEDAQGDRLILRSELLDVTWVSP